MQATVPGGKLRELDKCYVIIRGQKIAFNNIPDISDSKSAAYNDEAIIGRAFPMKTYSHSENRSINVEMYFYVTEDGDVQKNLGYLRLIESATYPQDGGQGGAPYAPPSVCKLRCGDLLATDDLCVVLKNYSVKFPRDVGLDEATLCPWMFQVSTQWDVVYRSTDLPGQERIVTTGR
jgi:hypothetical protein